MMTMEVDILAGTDDLVRVATLLNLQNLEEDTVKDINAKMRELIADIKVLTPEEKKLQEQVVESLMNEWVNGDQKEGEPVG